MRRLISLGIWVSLAVFAGDVNDELLSASRKGDLAAVKALCEQGAAIEAKTPYGQTPLYLAAMNGHNDVVQFLISKGAKTDVKDTFYKASVLGFVIERKHIDVAKTLIAKGGGNPDELLGEVAQSENAELVEAALAKGKPSQAALDKNYEAALEQKQTKIAELLKQAGAHQPPPPVVVDPKILESYVGNYKSEQIPLEIKAFIKDGKLNFQATGQGAFVPKPKSPTVFEHSQFGLVVEFQSATNFTLKQGGREFKFTKAVAQ